MTESRRRVTRIEPQKRNLRRFNLFLDGEFAFGLDQTVLLECHLHEGDSLAPAEIGKVLRCEARHRAKEKALRLIAYRPRSVEEVRKRLRETGCDPSIVQEVIDNLVRVNLLNDAEFAASYVRSRLIQKPISRRLMESELRAKGIADAVMASVLEREYETGSDEAIARELIRKKVRQYAGQDPLKVRKKLSDFLARRGFGWDVIGTVVREELRVKNEERMDYE
ncbi:MAG TPA: hypothetical protein ENN17_06190 [bacterium]|nr:hypothetical protein [bacterium]